MFLQADAVPSTSTTNPTPWILIAGVVVFAIVMLRMGSLRNRYGASLSRRSDVSASRRATAGMPPPAEYDQVLVKLQEVTREIEARLDTRVRFANRLLQELEQAEARLKQLLASAEGVEYATAEAAVPPMSARTAAPSSDNSVAAETPQADPAEDPIARDREVIGRLYRQGMPPAKIAVKLGRPVGEIELILALSRPPGA